jgi:hypothetical protein
LAAGKDPRRRKKLGQVVFDLSTELSSMQTSGVQWARLVKCFDEPKAGWPGRVSKFKLAFTINWDTIRSVTSTSTMGFLSDVDYIGADAYFPVADKTLPATDAKSSEAFAADPTGDGPRDGWNDTKQLGSAQNAMQLVEALHTRWDKPVVLSELGYTRWTRTMACPNADLEKGESCGGGPRGAASPAAQAVAMRGAYRAWTEWAKADPDRTWFKGFWTWATDLTPADENPTGFEYLVPEQPARAEVRCWTVDPVATCGVAPTIESSTVAAASPTSATVTGSFHDYGLVASYFVEYAIKGQTPASVHPASGAQPQAPPSPDAIPVSFELPGLQSGKAYEARLVVRTTAGTTRGPLTEFTTP